jgi:hypothetical protein
LFVTKFVLGGMAIARFEFGGNYDQKAQIGRVPIVFEKEGRENGKTKEFRNFQDARSGGKTRARDSIF